VGAGVELSIFAGFADIDFSDTNILITADRDPQISIAAFWMCGGEKLPLRSSLRLMSLCFKINSV
jgi:hypothetical protein